jgi:hypothetical protein
LSAGREKYAGGLSAGREKYAGGLLIKKIVGTLSFAPYYFRIPDALMHQYLLLYLILSDIMILSDIIRYVDIVHFCTILLHSAHIIWHAV